MEMNLKDLSLQDFWTHLSLIRDTLSSMYESLDDEDIHTVNEYKKS